MLFNSYEFILLFLPVAVIVFFLLNKLRLTLASKVWLVTASLFFYSWWNIKYLPLILGSVLFNYVVGRYISRSVDPGRKIALVFGICMNLLLLGYYKYTDFFISNINTVFDAKLGLLSIVLPLAISFFTFTQIAYLSDAYRGKVKEYSLTNYALFVTFFPQLIAGPIVHHREMMPQFYRLSNMVFNYRNLSMGLYLFLIGLFKKVALADTFAVWANQGFDTATTLTLLEAWRTSLSYTFQLYFDFSGYTDMALGGALMFNIRLPKNFNSPYKALSVQDFWRRWHMTLGRFLRDYVYIPLGGNRSAQGRVLANIMLAFLIGGIWHGAGWTFVLWGFLHGTAMVLGRLWGRLSVPMPRPLAWFLTFNFLNFTWVFFRAEKWGDAVGVLKGMVGMNGVVLDPGLLSLVPSLMKRHGAPVVLWTIFSSYLNHSVVLITAALLIVSFSRNSDELCQSFEPGLRNAVYTSFLFFVSLLYMNLPGMQNEFLYFNF